MCKRTARFFWAVLTLWLLAACGDGDAPDNSPPVAAISTAQTAMAGATLLLDGSSSLSRSQRNLIYSWQLTGKPQGSTSELVDDTSALAQLDVDLPGAYAVTLTVNDGVRPSTPVSATVTILPTDTLRIRGINSSPDPNAGVIHFFLTGPVVGAPVTWLVCGNWAGDGPTLDIPMRGPCSFLVLDVTAQIKVAADKAPVEIKASMKPADTVPFRLEANATTREGQIDIEVHATSPYGIADSGITASLDGQEAKPITRFVPCEVFHPYFCDQFSNTYLFTLRTSALVSGWHAMQVTAIDQTGDVRQKSVAFEVSNAPQLEVLSPQDMVIAHGSLPVAGRWTSDKPGPASVTATLGPVQQAIASTQDFSDTFDLTAVPPGLQKLTVRVTDSTGDVTQLTRQVIVASSAALAYAPALVLQAGDYAAAAESHRVLYSSFDGSMRLRDLSTGMDALLQETTGLSVEFTWRLSGGVVFASGTGPDCNTTCVYQWSGDGSRSNLSNDNPYSVWNDGRTRSRDGSLLAKQGTVSWFNDTGAVGHYTVHQIGTNQYLSLIHI